MSDTLRIASDHPDHEGGFYVIDAADFDADTMTIFGEEPLDADGDGKATKAELMEQLTAKGVEFSSRASKADLAALLAQQSAD